MDGMVANYLGRIVSKENFRVFIYSSDGAKKLVNSWDEYQSYIETGLWFATPEDVNEIKPIEIKKKKKSKTKEPELILDDEIDLELNDGLAFEV